MRVSPFMNIKRKVMATNVSTCGLQWQSHRGKQSSMKYSNGRVFNEHTITHNKRTQTLDFPVVGVIVGAAEKVGAPDGATVGA